VIRLWATHWPLNLTRCSRAINAVKPLIWKSGFRRRLYAIALKRGKVGPRLLFRTNRKSHMLFWLVPKSTTWDDLGESLCTLFQNTCAILCWLVIYFYFQIQSAFRRMFNLMLARPALLRHSELDANSNRRVVGRREFWGKTRCIVRFTCDSTAVALSRGPQGRRRLSKSGPAM